MMYRKFFLLLCILFAANAHIKSDSIITSRRKLENNIIITKQSFTKVWYYYKVDSSRTLQSVDRTQEKIIKIERDKANIYFTNAENYFRLKSYKHALKSYINSAKYNDWTKQHCLYKIALCYQNLQKLPLAVRWYKRLLRQFKDSYYKADATFNMGHCYLKAKKFSNAYHAFNESAKLYKQILGEKKSAESIFFKATSGFKAKRYRLSIKIYEKLLEQINKGPLKNDTMINLADCYFYIKDYSKAKKCYFSLLKENLLNNKDLLGRIYLGLGNCYLHQENFTTALLCYLRTIMMYAGNNDTTKKAFQKASYCFKILKNQKPKYSTYAKKLKQRYTQIFGSY